MGIFNGRCLSSFKDTQPTLETWSKREATIRFAFGSFRAEVFVSLLLNVRPLVSPEEINLQLPSPDELWMGSLVDQQEFLKSWRISSLLYSDLIRIAMDRVEILPDVSVAHRDLILFGAQDSVWRFSHDPDLFSRLVGFQGPTLSSNRNGGIESDLFTHTASRISIDRTSSSRTRKVVPESPEVSQTHDHLEAHRQMTDLQQDHERTLHFLREWRHSYIGNQSSSSLAGHRFNLLNSRLLYHLSFLNLRVNIPTIEFAETELENCQKYEQERAVEQVWVWSQSASFENALQHACAIWVLISSEYTWKAGTRARFNIVCLIALHSASKVVWAYAGTHERSNGDVLKIPRASKELLGTDLLIFRDNSDKLMLCFHKLMELITKGWISWFPAAVKALIEAPFPLRKQAGMPQAMDFHSQSDEEDHLS